MLKVKSLSDQKYCSLDYYFAIPAGNNGAGITWAAAIIQSGRYITEVVGEITYVKVGINHKFSSRNISNAERVAELTALNTSLNATASAILQNELQFTGYTIGG